jgi:hypothetical protein
MLEVSRAQPSGAGVADSERRCAHGNRLLRCLRDGWPDREVSSTGGCMNRGLFIRIVVAAIVVIGLHFVIPAFARILGFPINGDLLIILNVSIAATAILYVIFGKEVTAP